MAEPLAEIRVVLLPDGYIGIGSTCAGAPDSSYAPLADERASGEVGKLIGEIRARLSEGGEFVDLRRARLQAQAKVLACEVAIVESTPGALGSFGLLRLRARACLASLRAGAAAHWSDPEKEPLANETRMNAAMRPAQAAPASLDPAAPHVAVSHALEVTRTGVTETASFVATGDESSDRATNQQRCPMGATDIEKTMHAFVLRQAVNAAVDKVREGPERDPIKAAEQVVAAYTAATRLLQQGQSA